MFMFLKHLERPIKMFIQFSPSKTITLMQCERFSVPAHNMSSFAFLFSL